MDRCQTCGISANECVSGNGPIGELIFRRKMILSGEFQEAICYQSMPSCQEWAAQLVVFALLLPSAGQSSACCHLPTEKPAER